jgi:hypothetical protein
MTSCVHKMCKRTYGQTNMKRAITIAKFNHPWNRYNIVAFYLYLVSWLAMIWACAYYTDFTDGWFLRELLPFSCVFDHMSVRTSCVRNKSFVFCHILFIFGISAIREIGIIRACSDHGQPRYQIWIKCDKRPMTSCVHKMCGRTYCQANMKRDDLSMRMLYRFHGWLIFARVIALFMFVWPYVPPYILCTQQVICLLSIREIGIICACSDHGQPRYQIWIKSNKRQMTSYVHKV